MTDNINNPAEFLEEEEDIILNLTDDEGNEVPFIFLDMIEFEDAEYAVLMPADDDESGDVLILQHIVESDDEDTFIGIESDEIINAVFEIFKEKYKDVLDFAD